MAGASREPAAVGLTAVLDALRAALSSEDEAWIVGGAVRDALRGVPPHDVDVVVRGHAARVAHRLAKSLGATVYPLSERFATWRVLVPPGVRDQAQLAGFEGLIIDVAPLRGSALLDDLTARDFTVDAIAREVRSGEVVDPLGGRDDLRAGHLRLCSAEALMADPARVLRLVRLQHEPGLTPVAGVEEAARAAAPRLSSVSGERVEQELTRLLSLPAAARAVADLDRLAALHVVLPQVAALKGVTQNPYHHLDVFAHTLEALSYVPGVVEQLGGPAPAAKPSALGLAAGAGPLAPLAYAVLLHDIGKPAAREVDEAGNVRFWYHDAIGARLVGDVARRLHFSKRFEHYLRLLVRQHLRLGFLVREQPLSRRALARFRRDVEPYVFEAIVVSLCDRVATRGEKTSLQSIARHFRLAREVWEGVPPPAPRLLSGDDVMAVLGVAPGPAVGRVLRALQDEIEAGEVTTRAQAEQFVRQWWQFSAHA